MHKKKKWQLTLILTVAALTLYNILPTLFFYTKPLHSSIDETRARTISLEILDRMDTLETEAKEWVRSFCKLLHIKPKEIVLRADSPELLSVVCEKEEDARLLRKYLPRAGSLIPFAPSQLSLYEGDAKEISNTTVQIRRAIPVHFDANKLDTYVQFSTKRDTQGAITPLYRALVMDRLLQVALCLGGTSQNAEYTQALLASSDPQTTLELSSWLSERLVAFTKSFSGEEQLASRFFSSFAQGHGGSSIAESLVNKIEECLSLLQKDIQILTREEEQVKGDGGFLETTKQQQKDLLQSRLNLLSSGLTVIQQQAPLFSSQETPWSSSTIGAFVQEHLASTNQTQTLSLEGRNPFVSSIQLDWRTETMQLVFYSDLVEYKQNLMNTNTKQLDQAEQFLFNELAFVARKTDEILQPSSTGCQIALSSLTNSQSFLALRLSTIAEAKGQDVQQTLSSSWNPGHADLQSSVFPILPYNEFVRLPSSQKALSLVIYAPVCQAGLPENG
ncbi:MAG: hypothetical protein FJZ58_04360, partial [Chlamydiae bacterium]|nr:hypothetical protein [Chlamydiota bacterium]